MHGTPIYKTTFQRICANLRRGLNRRGGPDPIPPGRRHCPQPFLYLFLTPSTISLSILCTLNHFFIYSLHPQPFLHLFLAPPTISLFLAPSTISSSISCTLHHFFTYSLHPPPFLYLFLAPSTISSSIPCTLNHFFIYSSIISLPVPLHPQPFLSSTFHGIYSWHLMALFVAW